MTTLTNRNPKHEQVQITIPILVDTDLARVIKNLNEAGVPTNYSCAGFFSVMCPDGYCYGYISFGTAHAAAFFKKILDDNGIKYTTFPDSQVAVYWHPTMTYHINNLVIPTPTDQEN